ncbi:MAG: Asp-tRNA(Asn)/Glu-tRNA(Gln) amidotransferase subunit GatA [Cytophagales bacterium]|jgi:aspartyl-tRNA(Asn)/glutamyl-tRNA(Gln) amidotransferase subunit A|nr:Asp-tRNA(Asn)/Glu-tRNA(Gln) amidotransferase subunit GatA [Cytophagales bacterium]
MSQHVIENYFQLKEKIKTDKNFLQQTVEYVLKNISLMNSDLNAYVRVYEKEILDTIKDYDTNKNLSGMLVGLKDLFCFKDHPIQAASKILENFTSQINATVTQKIIDNGGIIVGHQNCDEFGMGGANEYSCYGPAHNGLDLKKTPGGSSGGSAAAVQNNMCHMALGTDTGGSVRQPAAFCGIIGLKPTYGRISRFGVIAHASSFDTVGIFGKSIEDIAILLENIAGKDEKDCTSSDRPVGKYFENLNSINLKDIKVAYLGEALELEGLQKEIYESVVILIKKLQDHGCSVEKQHFKYLDHLVPTYYVITAAEATTNLARYDGIRYGRCTNEKVDSVDDFVKKNRTEGFGIEVKRRILFGNYVLTSKGVLEKAQKMRRVIYDEMKNIFNDFDFIILPTTPTTAFDLNRKTENPQESYLADIFTTLASISGFPAISIPFGKDEKGLPIGIQIVANHFEEQKLLSFAKKILTEVNF